MSISLDGKKIVIFGGSGFIGKYLISKFSQFSCTIKIVSRNTKKFKNVKFLGNLGQVEIGKLNNFSEKNISEIINGSDIVINLIGILYENKLQKFDFVHSQLPGIIARSSKNQGVGNLIHLSALGVESNLESNYAKSKFQGEKNLKFEYPDATIIRPSVVFGKEDNFVNLFSTISNFSPFLPIIGDPKIIFKNKFFPILNFSEGTLFQPIYVGDLAEFILKTVNLKSKTFNLAGPNILTFKEIIKIILKYKKIKRLLIPVPFFAANLLAFFMEKFPQPPLTKDQVLLLKKDNVSKKGYFNLSKYVRNPKSLEVIIPTYIT
ncbi:MAG: hypothetical protein CMP25_02195 [Rickettsiales bacterium]|nr:hypothetical protein [Rickettsiales bacterium]|tara:strand:+ start:2407 stop:3366 length:960 start_codon:yes stop_codon:yes gene_type:complete